MAKETYAQSGSYRKGHYSTLSNPKKINHPASQDSNLTLVARWPYGSCMAVFVKGDYAYVGNGSVMTILNISNPASPKKVGEIETPGIVKDIYIWRHYAYIANWREGLRVIDVSDPSDPVEVGYEPVMFIRRLTGYRGVIYASKCINVAVINISAPTGPDVVGYINTGAVVWDVALLTTSRTYLFIASSLTGLRIFDVTNIYNVSEIGFIDPLGSVCDVFILGGYAYIVNYSSLHVIDLSNPSEPVIVGSYQKNARYQFCNVFVSDGLAYITDVRWGGLWIIDVSNPANPVEKGFYYPGAGCSEGIIVDGRHAFVAHGSAGLHILDVSAPDDPKKVASYQTGSYLNDSIFVLGNYAYTIGETSLVIVDVSDPSRPRYHASTPIDANYIVDVKVSGDYAYAAGYFGLGIIDVSDPGNPAVVGVYLTEKAYSVSVKDPYAYVACWDGFRVIDVSNKSDPREVWFYETEETARKVNVQWNYAYLAVSSLGLQIFDISTPHQPVLISQHSITEGSMVDMHISETYAYVAAMSGGLKIIDVSRPENPVEVSTYPVDDGTYYDVRFTRARNLYVSNNLAYVTDGVNGLWVFDVSLPESIKNVAWFPVGDYAQDVFVSGNLVYLIAGDAGLYILRNELAAETEYIPKYIYLRQNYPNPFNTSTNIRFELSVPNRVTMKLFDINGREVATLVDNVLYNSGSYEIEWASGALPSGVYIYRFHAGDHVETKKMILIR